MTVDSVTKVIRERRTTKLRLSPDSPMPVPPDSFRAVMEELVDLASTAPHHFPCHTSHQAEPLDSPVPWRFHCLSGSACRELMSYLLTLDGLVDKLAAMLAAADGLILAMWLPDPPSDPLPGDLLFDPTRRNMEHVAGVAAAVQNILLGATSRGIRTYWGSGGALRRPEVMERLGIPSEQILLGAVFLFPDSDGPGEAKGGARRGTPGARSTWMRWVDGAARSG